MKNIGALIIVIGIGVSAIFMPKIDVNLVETAITYTDAEFIQALLELGYPVDNIETYDEVTDPNHLLGRPGGYIGKTSFEITNSAQYAQNMNAKLYEPTLYVPANTIEMFSTPEDAQLRKQYVEEIHQIQPLLGTQYIYLHDVFLLRIESGVLPSEAVKYEAALADAVAGRDIAPW